jgi:hypothetical protein
MAYIYGSEVKLGTATAVAFSPEYSAFWRYFIATKENFQHRLERYAQPPFGYPKYPRLGD